MESNMLFFSLGIAAIAQGIAPTYWLLFAARAFSGVWAAVGSSAQVCQSIQSSRLNPSSPLSCHLSARSISLMCAPRLLLGLTCPGSRRCQVDFKSWFPFTSTSNLYAGAAMIFGPGLGGGLSRFGKACPPPITIHAASHQTDIVFSC